MFLCRLGWHRPLHCWYESDGRHLKCWTCKRDEAWLKDYPRLTRMINALTVIPHELKRAWQGRLV